MSQQRRAKVHSPCGSSENEIGHLWADYCCVCGDREVFYDWAEEMEHCIKEHLSILEQRRCPMLRRQRKTKDQCKKCVSKYGEVLLPLSDEEKKQKAYDKEQMRLFIEECKWNKGYHGGR
jgi:hypothetical protein